MKKHEMLTAQLRIIQDEIRDWQAEISRASREAAEPRDGNQISLELETTDMKERGTRNLWGYSTTFRMSKQA